MFKRSKNMGLDKKILFYIILLAVAGFSLFSFGVIASFPISSAEQQPNVSRERLLIYGFLLHLLGILIMYRVILGVTKPIRSLRDITSDIAAGNMSALTTQIPEAGSGETLELIKSFNKMQTAIINNSEEISKFQDSLEGKVAERTKNLESAQSSMKKIVEAAREIAVILDDEEILRRTVQLSVDICNAEGGIAGWIENGRIRVDEVWNGQSWKRIDLSCAPSECSEGCVPTILKREEQGVSEQAFYIDKEHLKSGSLLSGSMLDLDLLDLQIKSSIHSPIVSRSDGLLGFIEVYNKKDGSEFTSNDSTHLSLIANSGSAALENAVLFSKISKGKKEWETTYDAIPDIITIHDKDFNIIRYNKAAEHKVGIGSALLGKKCYEVFHDTLDPIARCPFSMAIKERTPQSIEIVEDHIGGVFNILVAPLFQDGNKQGEVNGCVHIIRDITQQHKLQQQLLQSEKLSSIGELVSGVAHELNNPLSSVMGFAQLLEKKIDDDASKKDLNKISAEARRAANIVGNLLTFARKETPGKNLIHIENIINGTLDLRSYDLNLINIKVERSFRTDTPAINADADQLRQVMLNLINNAEQSIAAKEGGGVIRITVAYDQDSQMVEVKVGDDGAGISEDALAKIFDPFFTTKDVGKGSGLGLSVVYGIMKQHGGTIVASNNENGGATFKLYFPALESTNAADNGYHRPVLQ